MIKEHSHPTSGYGMYSEKGVLLAHHEDKRVVDAWLKRPRTGAGELYVRPIVEEVAA